MLPSLNGSDEEKTQTGTLPRKTRRKKFDPEQVLPVFNSSQPLHPARSPPSATFWDYFGFLRLFRPIFRLARGRKADDLTMSGRVRKRMDVESNVPLEITLFLSSYLAWLMKTGLLQPAIATGLVTNIGALQDTFNNLERIRNTPLPFAYQAHLRISVWFVYCYVPLCADTDEVSFGQVVPLFLALPNLRCF